jgi:hypothetical protein
MEKLLKYIIPTLAIILTIQLFAFLSNGKPEQLGAGVVQLKTNNGKSVTTYDNGATTSLSVYNY